MSIKKRKHKELTDSQIKHLKKLSQLDRTDINQRPPKGSALADQSELVHNNTYEPFPLFYVDKLIVCRNCSKNEVWTAENQKWWYEVAKGNIFSEAVKCCKCRKKEKIAKSEARRVHLEGIEKKATSLSRDKSSGH